jgi:hypothetical protein
MAQYKDDLKQNSLYRGNNPANWDETQVSSRLQMFKALGIQQSVLQAA